MLLSNAAPIEFVYMALVHSTHVYIHIIIDWIGISNYYEMDIRIFRILLNRWPCTLNIPLIYYCKNSSNIPWYNWSLLQSLSSLLLITNSFSVVFYLPNITIMIVITYFFLKEAMVTRFALKFSISCKNNKKWLLCYNLFSAFTVGKNIIPIIKMRNNFCYPLKMRYWTFLYCSLFSYCSSNFAIAKVVALNLFASIFV